ncbi:hypothetical protein EJ05DRAFT_512330 [Pseudovirgaria hyperparasitica]|uniref:Uncharacterized protein n=1 Tax=Pseudovirgaria hyperparasitica TaxID=470096 RepID=A0A6A6W3U9_9PEZI|nr:uncharacterized protein EJ05DRAFT_512330 [Pseudovirgaria hyperparasitica]KAF2756704.1 hypothetical protein EJ05DRAFT_512330 [Pseudovirgaria hyperparasitica]
MMIPDRSPEIPLLALSTFSFPASSTSSDLRHVETFRYSPIDDSLGNPSVGAARRYAELYHLALTSNGEISPKTKVSFTEDETITERPKLRRISARVGGYRDQDIAAEAASSSLELDQVAEKSEMPPSAALESSTASQYESNNKSRDEVELDCDDTTHQRDPCTDAIYHGLSQASPLILSRPSSTITFSDATSEYHERGPTSSLDSTSSCCIELEHTLTLANALIGSLHADIDMLRLYMRRSDAEIQKLRQTVDYSNEVLGETYNIIHSLEKEISEVVRKLEDGQASGKKGASGSVSGRWSRKFGKAMRGTDLLQKLRDDQNMTAWSMTNLESSLHFGTERTESVSFMALRGFHGKVRENAKDLKSKIEQFIEKVRLCQRLQTR